MATASNFFTTWPDDAPLEARLRGLRWAEAPAVRDRCWRRLSTWIADQADEAETPRTRAGSALPVRGRPQ